MHHGSLPPHPHLKKRKHIMLGRSVWGDPKSWSVVLFILAADTTLPGRVDAATQFDAVFSSMQSSLSGLTSRFDVLDSDALAFAAIAVVAMEVCFWSTIFFFEVLDKLKLFQVRECEARLHRHL